MTEFAVSVVIPTLNEVATLPELVGQLKEQTGLDLEIVVVDGGSTDGTCNWCVKADVDLAHSAPGRGRQMNTGARIARKRYLLFLHADTRLSGSGQLRESVDAFQAGRDTEEVVAAHFQMQFRDMLPDDEPVLRFHSCKTRLNRAYTFNGDQGLLIAREDFESLGGFDESLGFLEDQAFGRTLAHCGRWITLPSSITTSARRFNREGLQQRRIQSVIIMACFAISLPGFFSHDRSLYRPQQETGKLVMAPLFELAHRYLVADGPFQWLSRWYAIGGFTATNSWQLFLMRDCRRFDQRTPWLETPWLDWHDRNLERLVRTPVAAILGMIGAMSWFYPAWLRYRYIERHQD